MQGTITRADHLAWCKARALVYVDRGELGEAFASMASDLSKHPETDAHPGATLGMALLISGGLRTPGEMRDFIKGFN